LSSAFVDRRFTPKTKGACKSYVAILVCCRTWWLASSCDWWWVVIFLQYITTSHVNSVDSVDSVDSVTRWCGHKTEIWYSESTFMFTVIWTPSGFYVVDRLPNDTKMNSAYFMTNILIPLIPLIPLEQAVFPRGRAPHQKWLVIHLDNCSVHTSRAPTDWLEEYDIHRMLHPPYSPDLAPVTSICFLQSKKNSNWFSWLTRTSFLSACKRFWGVWINKNWIAYFRLGCGEFKK
jgi:transposase